MIRRRGVSLSAGYGGRASADRREREREARLSTRLETTREPAWDEERRADIERAGGLLARLVAEGRAGGGQVPQGVPHALEDDRTFGAFRSTEGLVERNGVLPGEGACSLGLD